jgi:two-component system, response regulator PdtaR
MAAILFVEDDPLIRHNLQIVLTAAGHQVSVAENAVKGYSKAQAQDWDLLLLDVGLPDESGVDLARRLRSDSCQAAIIFLTAYDDAELIQASIECQAHSYLIKPVSARQLIPVIETALAAAQHHRNQETKMLGALNAKRETSIAVGILAERLHCSPEKAFEEFRRLARSQQKKMELLAREIISGEITW